MAAGLLTLRGQSHRLGHPSRLPSPFALGGVLALTGVSVASGLVYLKTYRLVPPAFTALTLGLLIGFVLCYHAAATADPGPLEPTADLAATLRKVASAVTGQASYCPVCKVMRRDLGRHCRLCERCFRGQDHHCLYMASCVTAANRRRYLRALLLGAAGCAAYLCHVAAYLRQVGPADRWLPLLLGSDIYTGSCILGHVAALLFIRSLVWHELKYLWAALDGRGCRKVSRIVRYVCGGPNISHTESCMAA
ncbi:palmitoyltransferase AKR1-like [Pollicipes pollicipes]|uniref:palmitoyltransferase AKR1-like n=1 Tax=Pollicipes pollicipes TaxID=41117 RepID=UPI001884A7ED|nr:palmitoyltransferase AKR1-like [Pollicipes pollicipes]